MRTPTNIPPHLRARRPWRLFKTATLVLALGLMASLGTTAAANASTTPAAAVSSASPNGAAVAQSVLRSANPTAAYNALSASAKKAYGQAERPVSATVRVTNVKQTDSDPCWSAYVLYDWKAAAGNTVYTTWQGLDWCSNGSSITSWHVYVRGGETSTPGWSYEGNNGQGSNNVGWEVRQYTEQKFTFGIGQYGYSTSPCTQIRGGATGLYSTQASCNLG